MDGSEHPKGVTREEGWLERKKRTIEVLRREIHHDHRYHVLNGPVISDQEYDAGVAPIWNRNTRSL